MACSSGCLTKDHETLGACLRAKNLKHAVSVPANNHDTSLQKSWDKELDAYRAARAEGIQPAGTKMADVRRAREISDLTGKPYDAAAEAV